MTMKPVGSNPEMENFSGAFLFFGIALIVLGLLAITFSVVFTIGTIILFGSLLLAAGVAECIHAFRARLYENIYLNILSGIVYLVVGFLLLYNPLAGAISVTLIMSVFFFLAGILRCIYGFVHRKEPHMGWFVFGGVVNLILGILIATGWPVTGLWVIGLFVGIEMLFYGFACIALSNAARGIGKTGAI